MIDHMAKVAPPFVSAYRSQRRGGWCCGSLSTGRHPVFSRRLGSHPAWYRGSTRCCSRRLRWSARLAADDPLRRDRANGLSALGAPGRIPGATVLGIAAGVMTARLRVLQHLTEPLLHGFRAIPVIALVPVSVLWFGIGETAKIVLVATGAFFPIWIATFIGVRDVHIVYLRSAACLGAGRIATMFWVILPAALPFILAGLRQAMAISLIVLVAAELSGATAGVAYMMSMGHQLFRVDVIFIGLLLLGTLGFLFDRLFVLLTQRLLPW